MKNKLIVIGDSFSYGSYYDNNSKNCNTDDYVDLLHRKFKNHDLVRMARPGQTVQTIIDMWTKLIPNLNSNDILVVQFPAPQRWRTPLSKENYEIYQNDKFRIVDYFTTDYTIFEDGGQEFELPLKLFNVHYSNISNWNDIIDSLIQITNCINYVWSWDDWIVNNNVEISSDIKKYIGWETSGDEYIKTNGKCGAKDDFHFSSDMHSKFAEYAINKILSK